MKIACWIILIASVISCNEPAKKGPVKKSAATDTTATIPTIAASKNNDEDLNAPNVDSLKKRLFRYFETHKQLDTFTYEDDTYAAYWGHDTHPEYFINAGHIFNNHQVHAMVFYDNDESAGLFIYLKKGGAWKRILADENVACTSGRSGPELSDWNHDGIMDISMDQNTVTGEVDNYDLWLMDRSGEKLHEIKDFSEVPNPKVDSVTGIIKYEYTHNMYLTGGTLMFKNYKRVDLLNVSVVDRYRGGDSAVEVTCKIGSGKERVTYCSWKNAAKYVPEPIKEDVLDFSE